MDTYWRMNPYTRGHITNMTYLHILSEFNEKIEKMHLHYVTYQAIPFHKKSCLGIYEIYSSDRPFLGRHYYTVIKHVFRL